MKKKPIKARKSEGVLYNPGNDPEFEVWAFGENPKGSVDRMDRWNKLHGDKLWLEPTDEIYSSLKKMFAIYLKLGRKAEEMPVQKTDEDNQFIHVFEDLNKKYKQLMKNLADL